MNYIKRLIKSTTHKSEKIPIHQLLFLAFIGIALLFSLSTTTIKYDREGELLATFMKNGGCAWDRCPQRFKDLSLKESNGLLPPNKYKIGTKIHMRSYCTYLPDKCIY